MKKLSSIVILGALILAACGPGSGSVAATVDGSEITVGQVEDLIYVESGAVPKEQFAQFLAFQIQWEILANAVEAEYSFAPSEQEVLDEADNLYEQVPDKPEGQTREEFLQERSITELFLQNIGRQALTDVHIREELEEDAPEPTAEELEEARTVARASLTQVCASHILVDTAEEATEVRQRLDSGEEFGVIAQEVSTDVGSGANNGILQCTTADQYVPAFRDAVLVAPVGEVYEETVESTFGFHIITVTDRQDANDGDLPTDELLIDDFKTQWVATELRTWFDGIMVAATVTVDPEFGTWEPIGPNGPTIVPPQG